MPKKKAENVVQHDPYATIYNLVGGWPVKLLVQAKDAQWYEVPNGISYQQIWSGGYQVDSGKVAQVARDAGPIPTPKRWRSDA